MRKVQFEDQATADAFNRLVRYAECFRPGDVIHKPAGLTCDDLDLLIGRLTETSGLVSIRYVDLGDQDSVRRMLAETPA